MTENGSFLQFRLSLCFIRAATTSSVNGAGCLKVTCRLQEALLSFHRKRQEAVHRCLEIRRVRHLSERDSGEVLVALTLV